MRLPTRAKALLAALCLLAAPALADPTNFGGYDNGAPITVTTTTSNYPPNTVMGGLIPVNIFRTTSPPSGILDYFWAGSKGGSTSAVTYYIFDTTISPYNSITNPNGSTCTDGTNFRLGSLDFPNLVTVVTPTLATTQGASQSTGFNALVISAQNHDQSAKTYLYVCPVSGATQTPGSTTDQLFKLSMSQN